MAKQSKSWRQDNPTTNRESKAATRIRRRDADLEYARKYAKEHAARRAGLVTMRRRTDPAKKQENALRRSFATAVRRYAVESKPSEFALLGCSMKEFVAHIESTWSAGMHWGNWGKTRTDWQIDHVRPLRSFNMLDGAHVSECFHWSNTQALWTQDNIKKGPNK